MAKIIGKDAIQAPSGDAIGLRLKGRPSDNSSVLDFTNNTESIQQASITSQSSGLVFNLPDSADSYTFQVNGITEAVINSSGIDGQYITGITPASISESSIAATPVFNYASWGSSDAVLWNGSFTTTKANAYIQISLEPTANTTRLDKNGSGGSIDPGQVTLIATASGGYSSVWFVCGLSFQDNYHPGTPIVLAGPIPIAQTYSLQAKIWRARGGGFTEYGAAIVNYRFVIRQIV